MLVNFASLPDHGLPNFFRIILNQPRTDFKDLDFALDEFEKLGENITEEDLKDSH